MKAKLLLILSAMCLLNSGGCALSYNLLRTTVVQPKQFCNYWDKRHQERYFRKVARQEFERAQATAMAESDDYSCDPYSADEACGFEDGFVDYVMYGGIGNPPPLPPRRYWRSNYENAYQSIQDWYKGFRHGATVAQASGFRDCVTIQLSDGLNTNTLPTYVGQRSGLEYTEQHGPLLSKTDFEEPAGIPASVPELSTSSTQSAERLPAPESTLPAMEKPAVEKPAVEKPAVEKPAVEKPKTEAVHYPIITSPASPSIYRKNHVQPLSQSGPKFSQGVESVSPSVTAGSAGVKLASASEPASSAAMVVPIATEQLSFESLPPLSISQESPDEDQPIAIPATQAAPIRRLPVKSESGLSESQPASAPAGEHALMSWLAPASELETNWSQTSLPAAAQFPAEQAAFIEPESSSDVETFSDKPLESFAQFDGAGHQKKMAVVSKQNSQVKLWLTIAGAALLVAGSIYLVRRRPRSTAWALSQLQQFYHRARRSRWPLPESRSPTMPATHQEEYNVRTPVYVSTRTKVGMLIAMVGCLMSGCAALTNPVLNGIPVRKLPTELLSSPRRDRLQTIPLSLLRQKQPEEYVLAAGDVIGVFVAGVFPLTSPEQPLPTPPVYFPSQIDPLGAGLPPSLGYPVTIRNDGTLSLPFVEPIKLDGLTIEVANVRIREAYLDKGILQPGREEVLVTLMQPRQIRVLVFRQEVGGFSAGGRGDISGNNIKQGTGHIVDLRAYENDVVTALANTGGLAGLDAFDGVFIFRGGQSNAALVEALPALQPGEQLKSLSELDIVVDYIPTRWPSGEPLPFEPEDAILHEGDVVLLESRVNDVFYTGGLLPSGQQVLPRDYDLDVVEAVAQANGTLVNGAFGGNNFNGLLIQPGIGNPNPSALTVIRRTPDGGQIPISVDLNRALVDARERILIQPNDVLILQETGWEAIARYFGDAINFNVTIFQNADGTATAVQGN